LKKYGDIVVFRRCEIAPGVVHRKYLNLGWFIAIPVSMWFAGIMALQGYNYWFSFLFCIWNYWLCRFIDPDTDHLAINISESTGMRLFEKIPIIGWIVRAFWISYTTFYAGLILAVGGHRSFFSHSLIVGTIGRMIFFNIPMWAFIYWERIRTGRTWDFSQSYIDWRMDLWLVPYYLSQALLWTWGDLIHLILDTNIVKGILYIPESTRSGSNNVLDNFKPKYGKLVSMILKVLLGYGYNTVNKILNKR